MLSHPCRDEAATRVGHPSVNAHLQEKQLRVSPLRYDLDRHDFADLDEGFAAEVFGHVGDEVGCSGSEGVVEVLHGLEVEVAYGVVVRRRAGRKGADTAIDLDANEAA